MSSKEPPWITIDEAFAKLKAATGGEGLASHALFSALKSGTLKSFGRQVKGTTAYITDSTAITDFDLKKEIWNDARFSKSLNASGRLWFRVPQLLMSGGTWYVFVDGMDLDKMITSGESKEPQFEESKGGAPEKHTWAAAFAYCGWWVATNGLPPEKAQLVALVKEWFRTVDGGVPKGDRELRRRVAQAYDELSRLGAPVRDGFKPSSDP